MLAVAVSGCPDEKPPPFELPQPAESMPQVLQVAEVSPYVVDPRIVQGSFKDLTSVASLRTPWDNFTQADPLKYNLTNLSPADSLDAQWTRYKADPVGAMVRDGKVNFQIVSALYREGLVSMARRDEITRSMKAYVARQGGDPALKGNLVVALIHIGFEAEVFQVIEAYRTEAWWASNWDANFYAATLLFRHRRYEEAVPYLENALKLNPDHWTRLWLWLALQAQDDPKTAERRRTLFVHGAHMGGGAKGALPFVERSDSYGFRRWHLAGAVAFVDVDGDSWLDFIGNGVYAAPELYRAVPGEGYLRQLDPTLDSIANVPSACVAADFDNDGHTDLYFPSAAWFGAGPNKLLRNRGGAGFEDVSERGDAQLLAQNSCGVSTLDFDRDGLLDIAVTGTKGGSLRLLRNTGNMTFVQHTTEAGITPTQQVTVGLAVGDVNNDGWPDIYVNSFGPNALYINQGDGTFREEAKARGVDRGVPHGFGAWMFDYDNDGDMDIVGGNFATDGDTEELIVRGFTQLFPHMEEKPPYMPSALYKNDGTGHFRNIATEVGWVPSNVMGCGYADFDLDGDLDVVLGPGGHPLPTLEPVFLYRNDGEDRFTNITPLDDPLFYGKFHGTAFADLDRDGDPELYLNNGGVLLSDRFRDLVLDNTTTGKGWLHLSLVGTKSNRSGVGARVTVHTAGRQLHQERAAGQGFSSTNSPILIFGLDKAPRAEKVVIRWPSGQVDELGPLAANQALEITEGNPKPRRLY